jgi:CHAT domain-containing protein
MGRFTRAFRHKPAVSSPFDFDPVQAFRKFFKARTIEARSSAIRPEMLTDEYDNWLAGHLRSVWMARDDDLAHWGELDRITLNYCREVEIAQALRELDLNYPAEWQARLEKLSLRTGTQRPDDLASTVERLQTWLAGRDADQLSPYQRSRLERLIGDALSELSLTREGTSTMDAAVAHYEAAIQLLPDLDCLAAEFYAAASMVQNKRHDRTHSLRDLDLILDNAELAISGALYGQLDLCDYHGIWAAGLRKVGELTGDALYWEAAAGAYSQAAELSRPRDRRRSFYVEALGVCGLNATLGKIYESLPNGLSGSTTVEWERKMRATPELRDRFVIVPKNELELSEQETPHDLQDVLEAAERRLRQEEPGSLGAANQGLTIAQLLLERFRLSSDTADVKRANELATSALSTLAGEDLVDAYRIRADVLALQEASGEEIADILVTGMRIARDYPSLRGLDLARDCARHAVTGQDWHQAAEAYSAAEHIHAALVQRQVGRGYQEVVLALGPALGALAAVAFIHLDDPRSAVEALEFGRAQLMSTAMRRDAADLARVRALGAEELADQYVSALLRLEGAARQEAPDVAMAEAQQDLDSAVAGIRSLPGMGDFLMPLDATAMCSVAREAEATILFVVETELGGAVIAVSDDIRAELVPDLTHTNVRQHARAMTAAPSSADHAKAVDVACGWLGRTLHPALVSLALSSRVVLVPCGALAFLPLHAAWRSADQSQRSYLLDGFDVRYSANVQALRVSLGLIRPPAQWRTALVVSDPAAVSGEALPLAPFEVLAATRALQACGAEVSVASGADASVDGVLSALGAVDVVHLACHATADPDEPLHSGVLLADDQNLTVHHVMQAEVRTRLVVLSACESGAVGRTLPDEVISLPNGLIEAGCGSVIGSLWQVDEQTAVLVMLGLYDGIKRGMSPSAALGEAQRQLRESTNAELLAAVKASGGLDHGNAFRALVRELTLAEPEARAFSSAARSAAFVYVGG